MRNKSLCITLFVASLAVVYLTPIASAGISAKKGKEYKLTKKHGPWTIMVANFTRPDNFNDPKKKDHKAEGLTPREAANELVYELRKKGIPAYIFVSEDQVDQLKTYNRRGGVREGSAKRRSRKGSVCVLAGNYKSNKDPVGQKTLKWIENNFSPELLSGTQQTNGNLTRLKNGGVFRSSKASPLKGAFLTINPLLGQQESKKQFKDPLLSRLNPSGKCSIRDNKGKYTLVVASFYGKSITSVGQSIGRSTLEKAKIMFGKGSNLDKAGSEARILAYHLRENGMDAYVYHDRNKSVVTIGSYNDATLASAKAQAKKFGAKLKWIPQQNKQVLMGEGITLPLKPTKKNPVQKKWVFDPSPRLMVVPSV